MSCATSSNYDMLACVFCEQIKPAVSNNSIASMEDDEDKLAAGKEKMMFVLKELLDTEKEYVEKMNDLIKVGMLVL